MSDFRNNLKRMIQAQITDKQSQLETRTQSPLDELRGFQYEIAAYKTCIQFIDEAWRSDGGME